MSPLLEISQLTVRFGGVVAIDNLSLAITRGRLYGLVGPNGSGKTTLLGAISRLVSAASGQLIFDGQDYSSLAPDRVTHLGIARTFQNIRLLPTLTVRENVMMGVRQPGRLLSRNERAIRAAADEALERVAVAQFADTVPGQLPYGVQRRVEIARSLAAKPLLLLLDEPTAGMSESERSELAELFRQLRDEGVTQLLVEHSLPMIMSNCEHVFVMDFGRCIASGTPKEVTSDEGVRTAYLGRWGADGAA